jgi:hypothetical protein
MAGLGYLATDALDQGTRTIFPAACLELAIGTLAWAWWWYLRGTRISAFAFGRTELGGASRSSSAVGWTSSRWSQVVDCSGMKGPEQDGGSGGGQAMAPAPGGGGGHGGWLAGCCRGAAGGLPAGLPVAGAGALGTRQVGGQSEELAGLSPSVRDGHGGRRDGLMS